MIALRRFIPLLVALGFCHPPAARAAGKLPPMSANATQTSVSGLSSGGFMAVQYDVAFSRTTRGVGVVAGGPYNCAFVTFGGIAGCMQGAALGAASWAAADGFAALGEIDPVAGLAHSRVYLFSGTHDAVVAHGAVAAVRDFYRMAGVTTANITFVETVPAGHAFISPSFGSACPVNGAPFVNHCTVAGRPYDQPGAILGRIYGPLKARAATAPPAPVAFDQGEFTSIQAGMARVGYVFIPASCQASGGKGCAVHVVFHGCGQGAGEIGDAVYAKAGFNAWAQSNRVIVLYPQLDPTAIPANPQGCWDWWGYSGLNFQTKAGAQLAAVRAMVNRLTSH